MRVLIAAVSSATHPDGVTRHAVNLARCLLDRAEVTHVDIVAGAWQQELFRELLDLSQPRLRLHVARTRQASLARNVWYLFGLPALARSLKSDLVHLTYPAPLLRARLKASSVVTLHDLYPIDVPQNFGFPRVLLNRLILRRCLAAVDAIACVSNSTRDRLIRWEPRLEAKSTHIDNCLEALRDVIPDPFPELEHHAFLLAVAQHRHNKNIPLTLQILKRLLASQPRLLLCLVGRTGPETLAIHDLIVHLQLQANVLLLEGISDERMQWCYQHARLLLATSSVEGFGLPIAEAILTGCPVLCSDIPAFREIGEATCHFAPLDDAPAFTRIARQLLDQPRPAPSLLPQLSAAAVSAQYVALYHRLLSPVPHVVSALIGQKGGAQ